MDICDILDTIAASLTEEDVTEVVENSDANVDIPHPTTTALKKGFQMAVNLTTS